MEADERFMRQAIDLATANVRERCGGPFGAVVVEAGQVVATGVNEVTASHDPTAHAEIVAIRRAARALGRFELSGCTLYSNCEPCPMCLGAILWARLDALVFAATAADAAAAGFDDAKFYEQVRLQPEQRALPTANLLRAEAGASFAAWQACPERTDY